MATILAHITIKPGAEAQMEAMAKALYPATHANETHVRRYEYWRGQAERTYYTLLSFDDYVGFLEHQASPHHEQLTAGFGDIIESFRLEWLDPIQGGSPLVTTENQPAPPDANATMKAYAARMPAEVASWWLPLR
jgi:quinol monooxygenase YgiN